MCRLFMNIGTLSLNINAPDFNYGAILHSWAFQQYILNKGLAEYTEIINYTTPQLQNQHLYLPIIDTLVKFQLRGTINNIITFLPYTRRYKKFKRFIENNMIVSSKAYTQKALSEATLNYDAVICESDVIWSHGFFGGHFDRSFFCALDSMKKMKRIAYAPSMADGDLNGVEEEFKSLLTNLDYISCRESYEKEIIEKYTDKPVMHVVDPVLLLNEDDYAKIVSKRQICEKYVLTYLPVNQNDYMLKDALQYAKAHGYKLINIVNDLHKSHMDGVETIIDAGIEEFLSYIRNAEIIFTNSFHAICFSVIFKKQFYAFSRNYSGKVKDICQIMNLENRFFSDNVFREQKPIDYDAVYKILQNKINESELWLKTALQG